MKAEKSKLERKYEHCRSLYEKQKGEQELTTSAKATEEKL